VVNIQRCSRTAPVAAHTFFSVAFCHHTAATSIMPPVSQVHNKKEKHGTRSLRQNDNGQSSTFVTSQMRLHATSCFSLNRCPSYSCCCSTCTGSKPSSGSDASSGVRAPAGTRPVAPAHQVDVESLTNYMRQNVAGFPPT